MTAGIYCASGSATVGRFVFRFATFFGVLGSAFMGLAV
jgi:hypothetical protein